MGIWGWALESRTASEAAAAGRMGPPDAGKPGVYQGHGSPGKGAGAAHLGPGGLTMRTILPLLGLLVASLLLNTMWLLYARPQPQPLEFKPLGARGQGQEQGQGQRHGVLIPCPCANSTSLLSTQEEPPPRKRPKVGAF